MGVRPIRDIAKGEEIKQADVEQIALKKDTEIDIRRDNIKSIMSAVDRHAKRTIKKGELLMYKDFSTQSYGERPKPEFEPTEGCSNFHRYGPQP
jgi:flagella basal body P-ring formation protein FlgA